MLSWELFHIDFHDSKVQAQKSITLWDFFVVVPSILQNIKEEIREESFHLNGLLDEVLHE